MRKILIFTLFPVLCIVGPLNAQALRLDLAGSGSAAFKSEMEQREKLNSFLYAKMNGKWGYAGGAGAGPVGLGYLHDAGPGRFFIGGRYEGYSYTARHTDLSARAIHIEDVGEYRMSMVDAEIGYEWKSGPLTIFPKIGRRAYSKSYSNSSFELAYYYASNSNAISADAAGAYAGLAVELALNEHLAIVLDGAASAGPMKGSAELNQTVFASNQGKNRIDVSSQSMDAEVSFASARAGFKFLAGDKMSITIGVQGDEFKTGYPDAFKIGYAMNEWTGSSGFYLSSLESILVYNSIMWEKKYADRRTGVFFAISKDFDL